MKKITILLLAVLLFAACPKKKPQNANNEPLLTVYTDVEQRHTPESPVVYSQTGISAQELTWIDESLANLQADITAEGRAHNINPKDAVIYVLQDCRLSPESKTPSFLIRADNYNGSVYDQDPDPRIGRVLAAEMVISATNGFQTRYFNQWVVCSYFPDWANRGMQDDQARFKAAVRYGQEHTFLYFHYRAEFESTATHLTGGHPLIRERVQSKLKMPTDVFAVGGSHD